MKYLLPLLFIASFALPLRAGDSFQKDVIKTSAGDLEIAFLGHASLMLRFRGMVIYADPYSRVADFSRLPKADLLLITHEHQDHLDPIAIDEIRSADTAVVLTATCAKKLSGGTVMKNGDVRTIRGVMIEAIPAYNLVHRRENGELFHPRGRDNGYVLTFGATRVYIAGDTENTPEMKALRDIGVAFLPMNIPYTMTPEMVADAARAMKPRVLYPYHTGDTDTAKLTTLLKDAKGIDVRIRSMQ